MIGSRRFREINIAELIVCAFSVAVVFLLGAGIGTDQVSPNVFLYILVAAIFFVTILAGERGLTIGFVMWILSFGLGYRSIQVTSNLRIHPSEVVLWFLFVLLLFRRGMSYQEPLFLWLPRWLWLFIPFWIWGIYIGTEYNRPFDLMLAELKNFLLWIPLIFFTQVILKNRAHWPKVLLAFYAVGTFIAATGIIEYLVPSLSTMLPSLFHEGRVVTAEGFVRAGFSFWGTPAATFICVLSFIFANSIWRWWVTPMYRALIVAALITQLLGIYIGGYRSMWLTVVVVVVVWVVQHFGLLKGVFCAVPLLLSYQLLPQVVSKRLLSLSRNDVGHFADTSAEKRWDWGTDALTKAIQRPEGLGWGGVGWPHSDFIQVAANLGLLAGVLFLASYLVVLWRLWHLYHQRTLSYEQQSLGLTLLLSFIAVGSLLAFQGVQVLPQFVLPVWFVWTLAEVWLHQTNQNAAD
jgi:O-antigen ligase